MKTLLLSLVLLSSVTTFAETDFPSAANQNLTQNRDSYLTKKIDNYLSRMAGPSISVSYVSQTDMQKLMRDKSELKNYIKKQWNADEISEMRGFVGNVFLDLFDDKASEEKQALLIRVKKGGKSFLFVKGLYDRYDIDENKYVRPNDEVKGYCDVDYFSADDARQTNAISVFCDSSTGLPDLMIRSQNY
jgi:hypothetical protein